MDEKDNVKWLERSTKGAPRYIIILYSLIIALIASLILIGLQIGEYKVSEGYEIFRDILIIFLTILALAMTLVGYEIYQRILKYAEKSMKEKAEDFIRFSTAMLYADMGFFHWQHYKIDYKKEVKEENKQNEYAQDHKKKAIQLTEWAYKKILKLDVSEEINERLKCQIMNNLGWYLADGGEEKDRDFSKECACYIRERIKKFPYKRKQWQDTIDQIIKTYGPVNQSELE